MVNLYKKLKEYGKSGVCPMHMPGHKRKTGICAAIDITEIDGFDNLSCPTGILKELSDECAAVYGADLGLISVNGSTGSIFGAIFGTCRRGDKIIMARNCHKAVYNAVNFLELNAVYVFPDYDDNGIAEEISPQKLERAVEENKDAKLVVLTSPTYEGVISDVAAVCEIAHSNNIPVFVDAAHGAHLKFAHLPDPIECGADIAAVSLHKTLPAMTQCGLLLVRGERVSHNDIAEKIRMFMTSSPSYVLLASVCDCIDFLKRGSKKAFIDYKKNLDLFYNRAQSLEKLKIKTDGGFCFDRGKIVILTDETNISGKKLAEILRTDYKIELEMAYDNYALAMTTVCDGEENFARLWEALEKIDTTLEITKKEKRRYPEPQKVTEYSENLSFEFIKNDEAEGRICADFIWAYPPGVPIIAPGEMIDENTVEYLKSVNDTEFCGSLGSKESLIRVIKI